MTKRDKVHQRKDLEFEVHRLRSLFARAKYVCVISQLADHDKRVLYHVETFYGSDGRRVRAEAFHYGKDICAGFLAPHIRNQHYPVELGRIPTEWTVI